MAFENKKDPGFGDFFTMAVVGHKRQGKSTFEAEYAKQYMELNSTRKNPRRVLIHDPANAWAFQEFEDITLEELQFGVLMPDGKRRYWRKGIRRIANNGYKDAQVVETITNVFRNGLVIFDEAKRWVEPTKPPEWQKDLVTTHSNFCVDICFTFHNFLDVPVNLRGHIWQWVIFKTPDKDVTDHFPNAEKLREAKRVVDSRPYYADLIIQPYEFVQIDFGEIREWHKQQDESSIISKKAKKR